MSDDGRRWCADDGEWRTGEPPEGWARGEGGRWYPPPAGIRRSGRIALTWRAAALDAAEALRGVPKGVTGRSPAYALPAPLATLPAPAPLLVDREPLQRSRSVTIAAWLAAAAALVGATLAIATAASNESGRGSGPSTVEAQEPTVPTASATPPADPAATPAPASSVVPAPAPGASAGTASFGGAPAYPAGCETMVGADMAGGPRPGDGDGSLGCR